MERRSLSGPKPRTSARPDAGLCEIHGLRFDPSSTAGCVLCRKVETPPIQIGRYGLKDIATVAGAAVVGVIGCLMLWNSLTAAPDFVTHAEMVSGSSSSHGTCYAACANDHHVCAGRCEPKPSAS